MREVAGVASKQILEATGCAASITGIEHIDATEDDGRVVRTAPPPRAGGRSEASENGRRRGMVKIDQLP